MRQRRHTIPLDDGSASSELEAATALCFALVRISVRSLEGCGLPRRVRLLASIRAPDWRICWQLRGNSRAGRRLSSWFGPDATINDDERQLLDCAWETLESAGYDPLSVVLSPGIVGGHLVDERVSVQLGFSDSWAAMLAVCQNLFEKRCHLAFIATVSQSG